MNCPNCGLPIRDHEWHCPNCLTDFGAPNVRQANHADEVAALDARLRHAQDQLAQRALGAIGEKYLKALASSVVVLCRGYADVLDLLKSENESYATFYQLIEAEKRRPGTSTINPDRRQTDAIFFPFFERNIRFAALSLDGRGAAHYGPISMVLSASGIRKRCSFFEMNTVEFARQHNLGPGRPVPPGFRASWNTRAHLALAKGHPKIASGTAPRDFTRLLLDGDDFVEAHIFGPIHRRSIQQLKIREPSRLPDQAYVSEIRDVIARDNLAIRVTMV